MISNKRPSLLIDPSICRKNISRMAEKAAHSGLVLRPHFKTHQSREVGRWYREAGVEHITVSSVDMAAYFAGEYRHITIAIPVNPGQIVDILELCDHSEIAILIDSEDSLEKVEDRIDRELGVWIEIDTGSGRSGIVPSDTGRVSSLVNRVKENSFLRLEGLYSHPGHSYRSRGKDDILRTYEIARTEMTRLKEQLNENFTLNLGDTPCCSVANNFEGLDSMSPGNFVFYDLMQTEIGSCEMGDIAVCLACPVISRNPDRLELVVYGGGIHLSKERMEMDGQTIFGLPVPLHDDGWGQPLPDCRVKGLSQEHGVIQVTKEVYELYRPGDLIGILPVHSCMTADCMGRYFTISGREMDHMRASR